MKPASSARSVATLGSGQDDRKTGSVLGAGLRGRVDCVFVQDAARPRPTGLRNGDRLTIHGDDNDVIWSGTIDLVPRRWWDRSDPSLKCGWSETKQRGVRYATWLRWFHEQRRATFEPQR